VSEVSGHPPPAPRGGGRGAEAFRVSRFTRLARVQVFSTSGDALLTVALAGSIFFSLDADAARGRTALYLLLTMAPFAVVAPLIGPAIDRTRGGRRWMVMASCAGRAVVALAMARYLDSLLLFPLAFAALGLGKGYHVAKSALVPTLVRRDEELVEANSKLVLISGIAGAVAGPAAAALSLLGASVPLVLAAVVFGVGTAQAVKLPSEAVATGPVDAQELAELRGAGIMLGASATAILRLIVGFLIFLLAFELKQADAATIWYGVILAASVVGNFAGALTAPLLRRHLREERMLAGVLLAVAVVALATAWTSGYAAAAVLAFVVGLAAGMGKLAFDAIVQRDAPDANQGRSFARFETRFQLVWVVGALIPVLIPAGVMSQRLGFLVIGGLAAFGAVTYVGGLRATARGEATPTDRLKAKVWTPQARHRLRASLRRLTPDRSKASGPSPPTGPDGPPRPDPSPLPPSPPDPATLPPSPTQPRGSPKAHSQGRLFEDPGR